MAISALTKMDGFDAKIILYYLWFEATRYHLPKSEPEYKLGYGILTI